MFEKIALYVFLALFAAVLSCGIYKLFSKSKKAGAVKKKFRPKTREEMEEDDKKREIERQALIVFFNTLVGKSLFKMGVETAGIKDENACPLHEICKVWFAKFHDRDFPNFFVNPCWEMTELCLCPLRQEGCDNCPRKFNNKPLC